MLRLSSFLVFGLIVLTLDAGVVRPPIDKNHSSIAFHVPIMNGMSKVHGGFSDFDIQLDYDADDVTKSVVHTAIKADSINTGIAARDNDLRGPGFFDTAKYPTITFDSTKIEKAGDHYMAHGNFTMHGVTQEIEFPFKLTGTVNDPKTGKRVVGFAGTLSLNRRDYGINWTHPLDPAFVGDRIEVELEVLTKRF